MAAHGGEQAPFLLQLASASDASEQARLALLGWLAPFPFSEQAIFRIEVVLEELVTNVVRHSCDAEMIVLEAEVDEDGLLLAVTDDGEPFDPLGSPEPARYVTLEDAVPGGQGIPLIKRLSNEVTYQRLGGRNRMTARVAAT
nr:ATP-binding protein [Novosphingobium flavum]